MEVQLCRADLRQHVIGSLGERGLPRHHWHRQAQHQGFLRRRRCAFCCRLRDLLLSHQESRVSHGVVRHRQHASFSGSRIAAARNNRVPDELCGRARGMPTRKSEGHQVFLGSEFVLPLPALITFELKRMTVTTVFSFVEHEVHGAG